MRLIEIPPESATYLQEGDECFHIGEFVSHGGWSASETNRQIKNLKKKPSSSNDREMYYKGRAVLYWAQRLRERLNLDVCLSGVTFTVIPGSKSQSHPDYDDRLLKVLAALDHRLDVRVMVEQAFDRDSQNEAGRRLTPKELASGYQLNESAFVEPIKPILIVLDDVFTMGASFRAMKDTLQLRHELGETRIAGIFLARTVWEQDEFVSDFLGSPAPTA